MLTVSDTTPVATVEWADGALARAEYAGMVLGQLVAPEAPANATVAIVPHVPASPASYGAHVLRQLLAGGDIEIDPDSMAAAIAALEAGMLAPALTAPVRGTTGTRAAPRASAGTRGRVGYGGRTAPETGPNGEKLRKLWTVKAPIGPFLVGCVTGPGGAAVWVVRDTRTNRDHAEPKFAYARVGQAVAHAETLIADMPAETRASFETALLASGRIGTDKTAR